MASEFDKQIDSLLRANREHLATPSNAEIKGHLDADEISLFAENALPGAAKSVAIKHLADCDRCRTVFANTIHLGLASPEIEDSYAPAIVSEVRGENRIPWYERLFATKNLAYGFGALALLFAGLIGFSVVQNLTNSTGDLAQLSKDSERRDSELVPNAELSEAAKAPSEDAVNKNDANDGDRFIDLGEQDGSVQNSKDRAGITNRDLSELKGETSRIAADKKDVSVAKSRAATKPGSMNNSAITRLPKPPADVRIAEAEKSAVDAKDENLVSATELSGNKEAKRKSTSTESAAKSASAKKEVSKSVGGKNFLNRNGVWYDSEYRGQKTKTVKRGTASFDKLDKKLRAIAGKLDGTIVIIWKQTTYRID